MRVTQPCECADTLVQPLANDDQGSRALSGAGASSLADNDHVFYLSADRAPPHHADGVRSREILGW